MLGNLFFTVLYRPLFNLLLFFYKYLPGGDFGVAIIVLTVFIRFLLYPLGNKAIKSQKTLSELQPKMKEIQEKYKDNKEQQVKAMMELYKKEKISPFSGFLPTLIQLPILWALYQVFSKGFDPRELASVIYGPFFQIDKIKPFFLGIIDLSQGASVNNALVWPNVILIALVGIAQFIQMRMTLPKFKKTKGGEKGMGQFSNAMQKQMLYLFPLFTVFILWKLPAALGIYWLVTTLFSIVQQYFVFKKKAEPAA